MDNHVWLRQKRTPAFSNDGSFKILDLCCAPGGLSLGLQTAFLEKGEDIEIIGLDLDKYGILTYHKNHVGEGIKADIKHLPLRRDLIFDMVVGGVPCQGFSYINWKARKRGYDSRNDLIFVFADVLKQYQPAYFMFENVPGLLSLRWNGEKGGWFRRLLYQFTKNGYHWEWRLINAVHYGVPQDRKRVIVLGWLEGVPRWHFPAPTNYCQNWERCLECGPYILMEKIRDYPNVREYKKLAVNGS